MPQLQKNILLLSASKAAGNLLNVQPPGLLDWAQNWIQDFFARTVQKPILFVPYARAGGMTEQDYFILVEKRLKKMGIASVCAAENGITKTALSEVDGIFIGGGHTPTLLYKLQTTGSLDVIREAVNDGLPYLGSSAGTLIACPTIKTNNDMPGPSNSIIDLNSLKLIDIQINCHYMDDSMHDPKHQGETRDERLRQFCIFNPDAIVLGLYEGQALRVMGRQIFLWTSKQTRGLKTPIFCNQKRIEIPCTIDIPTDLSEILRSVV